MDEDLPTPRRFFEPPLLDRLGLAELEAYIGALRAEIARAEADIARKSRHRSAADSVFGKPSARRPGD